MALYINTNIASLYAQNNVANSQSALATSIQRLSSGLRINSAKDDAAGMAIAARMTSQIGGMNQAAQNANDGISMAQTAEGALAQVTNDLQTMRNLAVQAANGTNSSSDRASLQANISQLQQDISQIASNTQYNGLNLLDGSLSNVQFQTGANAGQTINATIGNASANSIGDNTASSATGTTSTSMNAAAAPLAAIGVNQFASQTLTISANGQTLTVPPTAAFAANTTAYAIAQQVNSQASASGVPIQAVATSYAKLSGFTAGNVSLTLQGTPTATGAANPVTISATLSSSTSVSGLAAAINAASSQTGITAVADNTAGTIVLTQNNGYDIGVTNTSASAGVLKFSGADSTGTALGVPQTLGAGNLGSATAATYLSAAYAPVTNTITTGTNDTLTTSVNGVAKTVTLAAGTYATAASFVSAQAGLFAAQGMTLTTDTTGTKLLVTVPSVGPTLSTLAAFAGNATTVAGAAAGFTGGTATAAVLTAPAGTSSAVVGGEVDFHSSSSFAVTSSLAAGNAGAFLATAASGSSALKAVNTIDVASVTNGVPTGANAAVYIVDGAINTINGLRAQLGALQNRFTNAQSALTTTSTNMQQARSRIQDTDFAAETANLTHNQILQQAGTAMLAQANALPNSVLTLLK